MRNRRLQGKNVDSDTLQSVRDGASGEVEGEDGEEKSGVAKSDRV